jgi:hypothetical protein
MSEIEQIAARAAQERAGLPPKGGAPSRPRASWAILRRCALGFIMVTLRQCKPPLYCYEHGTVIRGRNGYDELSETEFRPFAVARPRVPRHAFSDTAPRGGTPSGQ